jgi:hypothetical protein
MTRRILACAVLGGVVLSVWGCSDPVPPPAQGAVMYRFTTTDGASKCGVPTFIEDDLGIVSENERSPRQDGADGYKINCTVKQAGNGFRVNANITVVPGQVTQGKISLFAENTQAAYLVDPGTADAPGILCDYWVGAEGSSFSVGPGQVWGAFNCPLLIDPRNVDSQCAIRGQEPTTPGGYFTFQNCAE